MHSRHALLGAAILLTAACSSKSANSDADTAAMAGTAAAAPAQSAEPEQAFQWGPAPAVFPSGAEMAVLAGDPSKAELFTVRLRFPDGYRIAPHTHPTAENVTVISGTLMAGMGKQASDSDMQPFGQGAFVSIPAEHPHYVMARGATTVQVHAIGPFALTYVNPADNPAGH